MNRKPLSRISYLTRLSMLLALVILFNPFASVGFLWVFVGVSLMIDAVLDLLALIFNGKQAVNP